MVQLSLIRRTISRTLFKKDRPFGRISFIGLLFVIGFFVASYKVPFIQHQLEKFFLCVTGPIFRVYNGIKESTTENLATFKGLRALKEENHLLREEVQNLRLTIQSHHQEGLMMESLRNMARFKDTSRKLLATVPVLMQLPETNAHHIIIGSIDDQEFPQNAFVTDDKGLVGRLISTGPGYAKVQLLTDLNARVPIVTKNSNHHAILSGHNDPAPTLEFLNEDQKKQPTLLEGDEILTSAEGGVFAQNIPVGTLFRCDNEWCVRPYSLLSRTKIVSVYAPTLPFKSLNAP